MVPLENLESRVQQENRVPLALLELTADQVLTEDQERRDQREIKVSQESLECLEEMALQDQMVCQVLRVQRARPAFLGHPDNEECEGGACPDGEERRENLACQE